MGGALGKAEGLQLVQPLNTSMALSVVEILERLLP